MKISQEIIEDLIPVYLCGEASTETKEFIETYMVEHPHLAYLLESSDDIHFDTLILTPEAEMQSLKKIKFLNLLKTLFMGLAIFFTLSIFAFSFSSETGFKWLMLGQSEITMVYACFAAVFWAITLAISWRKKALN